MKQDPYYLIVISAPSGAGKTTLCRKLLEEFPAIKLSISSTTRSPRGSEQDGVDYFFLSRDEFEQKIKNGQFAEWALVHDHYYGTSKSIIQNNFAQSYSVLLDIDVQGAKQLKTAYLEKCKRVFIAPPSFEVLEARLRGRGTDSEETIQKRLKNAKNEMDEGRTFDFVIINDDLKQAYQELKSIIETHLGISARKDPSG